MESIASRYALALHKLGEESGDLSSFLSQLMDVQALVEHDASFLSFLLNPFYTNTQKETLLRSVFSSQEGTIFLGFFLLLLQNHLLRYVPAMLEESIRLSEYTLGLRSGILYTATSMSDSDRQSIEKALSDLLHITLTLQQEHAPELLGGFRVNIDGKVYDASVLGKLDGLKSHLKKRGS